MVDQLIGKCIDGDKVVFQFSSVALLCPTLCNPWAAACQASLSIINPHSLLKLTSIEWVMPSNHLIFPAWKWFSSLSFPPFTRGCAAGGLSGSFLSPGCYFVTTIPVPHPKIQKSEISDQKVPGTHLGFSEKKKKKWPWFSVLPKLGKVFTPSF